MAGLLNSGKASQSKQVLMRSPKDDLELTVAQIISFSQQHSGLNQRNGGNHQASQHNLNQISEEHTAEVTNRFKALDLVNRGPEELWTEVHSTVQEVQTKPSQSNKAKWLSGEILQIAEERREAEAPILWLPDVNSWLTGKDPDAGKD